MSIADHNMPAAIERYGNSVNGTCCAIGWVGSTAQIGDVDAAIGNWLASPLGNGWPLYVDQSAKTNPPTTVKRKVPSALEIFLNRAAFNDTSNFYLASFQSPQLIRMKALWRTARCRKKLTLYVGGSK